MFTHFFPYRLHKDAAALKAAWDAQITQMSKEAVSKDLQVQMLQEEEAKLKAQVAGFQKDIDRYCPQCPQGSTCAGLLQTRTAAGRQDCNLREQTWPWVSWGRDGKKRCKQPW